MVMMYIEHNLCNSDLFGAKIGIIITYLEVQTKGIC